MSFFKKIFTPRSVEKKDKSSEEVIDKNLTLDQLFVSNFIKNEGRFLYCTSLEEATQHLKDIIEKHQWEKVICNDYDLLKMTKVVGLRSVPDFDNHTPAFVACECLIAENGSILFSSNQLKRNKLAHLSPYFIVYATTSQIARSKSDSLTSIKLKYGAEDIPSNISAIKHYNPSKEDDFLNYGTNAKNVYLILFEDL